MKAQLSKMALIGLCLLLLISTLQSLSQGQQLYRSFTQWQAIKPVWEQAESAPRRLEMSKAKLQALSQSFKLSNQKLDITKAWDLVQYLEAFCEDKELILTRLPVVQQKTIADIEVINTQFSLEGSLLDILRLLYQMEYQDRLGELTQLELKTDFIRKNGKKRQYLFAHVTLQNPVSL